MSSLLFKSEYLRQYCQLDTAAMVIISEHWRRVTGLAG
jgi:hypothetical protein